MQGINSLSGTNPQSWAGRSLRCCHRCLQLTPSPQGLSPRCSNASTATTPPIASPSDPQRCRISCRCRREDQAPCPSCSPSRGFVPRLYRSGLIPGRGEGFSRGMGRDRILEWANCTRILERNEIESRPGLISKTTSEAGSFEHVRLDNADAGSPFDGR